MKIFTVGTNVHFSESEESECHSVMSDSETPWTAAPQAPLSMEFSSKNTRVGCHCLLQRILLTQGSNQVS